MQINLLLVIFVCFVPVFQETSTPIKSNQTFVEVWCGGDDNLTRGVCRAVYNELLSSPDFDLNSEEKPGRLIVTIPTNVKWKQHENRTRIFYRVEFTSTKDKKLSTKKGDCWEDDLKTCAFQVVRQAKIAARKLATSSMPD